MLTNDDGFEARGLLELAAALRGRLGERFAREGGVNVTIVAPSCEKSASSHSLTLTRPLRFVRVDDGFFKLDDATPADCVYLALEVLFGGRAPDLVISGINHGANLGEDVGYSGTVGAAAEAALQGVAALAVSQYYERNSLDELGFALACELACDVAARMLAGEFALPPREVLSLNVPAVSAAEFAGVRAAACGRRAYSTSAAAHRNPRGLEFWWLGTPDVLGGADDDAECDLAMIRRGFATLTPLKFDFTARGSMGAVQTLASQMR